MLFCSIFNSFPSGLLRSSIPCTIIKHLKSSWKWDPGQRNCCSRSSMTKGLLWTTSMVSSVSWYCSVNFRPHGVLVVASTALLVSSNYLAETPTDAEYIAAVWPSPHSSSWDHSSMATAKVDLYENTLPRGSVCFHTWRCLIAIQSVATLTIARAGTIVSHKDQVFLDIPPDTCRWSFRLASCKHCPWHTIWPQHSA